MKRWKAFWQCLPSRNGVAHINVPRFLYTLYAFSKHVGSNCGVCLKTCWSLQVMVFGEITTASKVDYEAVVRKTCRDIGFTSEDVGLDADKCKVSASPICHL